MTSPAVRRPSAPLSAPSRRSRVPLAWPATLAAGAAVVALSAQVAIPVPFSPVPMTLQPLAVLLVGGMFGAAAGAGALLLYLVAGAFGAPVFAPIGPQGLTGATLDHLAHDHVVDGGGIDPGAGHRLADGAGPELRGRQAREPAQKLADRGPAGGEDDWRGGVGHGFRWE